MRRRDGAPCFAVGGTGRGEGRGARVDGLGCCGGFGRGGDRCDVVSDRGRRFRGRGETETGACAAGVRGVLGRRRWERARASGAQAAGHGGLAAAVDVGWHGDAGSGCRVSGAECGGGGYVACIDEVAEAVVAVACVALRERRGVE